MQYITQNYLFQERFQKQQNNATQKQLNNATDNKWLRRIVRQIYKAGFAFFLIKGLLWITVGVWVVY